MNIELSLIFPAYNEERNIKLLLTNIIKFIPKICNSFEVIIVNDGSTDSTGDMINSMSKIYSWLKPIHHSKNLGYGSALKSGILSANGNLIFYTDADLQFDLRSLAGFLPYIDIYDAILGYRAPRKDNIIRTVNAYLWNILIRILFGLKVKDIDCAFKLFKSKIKFIVKDIRSTGATFSAELLIRMKKANWNWIELPVKHFKRIYGRQTGADIKVIIKAFYELYKLHKHLIIK